jgi:hypothetical protein
MVSGELGVVSGEWDSLYFTTSPFRQALNGLNEETAGSDPCLLSGSSLWAGVCPEAKGLFPY